MRTSHMMLIVAIAALFMHMERLPQWYELTEQVSKVRKIVHDLSMCCYSLSHFMSWIKRFAVMPKVVILYARLSALGSLSFLHTNTHRQYNSSQANNSFPKGLK